MKDLNLYVAHVNVHGPVRLMKGSATGVWAICETSEKNAHKVLNNYLKENDLIGSCGVGSIWKTSNPPDLEFISRGDCMRASEYHNLIAKKIIAKENKYQFEPKVTEKGLEQHKVIRKGNDTDKSDVPGAFGKETDDLSFEDLGDLPDIEGVTFNGKSLTGENLGAIVDEMIEDDLEMSV